MSARVKLALSYAAFVTVTGLALLVVVWVFLLRYVPDESLTGRSGWAPSRTDLLTAFLPKAVLMLAALMVVGLVGGWFLAGRMLAPLRRITEVSRRAGAGELDARVTMTGRNDEFGELADAFDTMLTRIEAHVAEQRRFAANASHELRTPLATSQAILDVALSDPGRSTDDATARDLRRLRAVNTRAAALAEDLLLLSRVEQGPVGTDRVDLTLLVDEAEELLVPLSERLGVVVETEVGGSGDDVPWVAGSASLLGQLVTNLVQNALVHNLPSGGWVRVAAGTAGTTGTTDATGTAGDRVVLRVENPGPAVDPALIPLLTEPFHRGAQGRSRASTGAASTAEDATTGGDSASGGDGSDSSSGGNGGSGGSGAIPTGAGLGLAIVAKILEVHHGSLTLTPRDPRDGGGLTVTVELPAA